MSILKICGMQKLSLIDYPGHLACVVFTRGCNLRCPYCHNPELVDPEKFPDQDVPLYDLWSFLEERKGFLDGVCITGGEPTLQEDLVDLIEKIRIMGFRVKLDTNGSRPGIIQEILRKDLADYIAMDVKVPLERYPSAMGFQEDPGSIRESIDLLKSSEVTHEFRTTVVPGIHSSDDMEQIGHMVRGSEMFFIQNFRPSKHLEPNMSELRGFPRAELDKFREIVGKYVKQVEIRS